MPSFVHCNLCGKQPITGMSMKFYVGACGHVLCNFCNEQNLNQPKCPKCNRPTAFRQICRDMKGKEFFMDQEGTIEKITNSLEQIEKKYGSLPVVKQDNTFTAQNEDLSELYKEADESIAISTKAIEDMTKAYKYLTKLMSSSHQQSYQSQRSQQPKQ